MYPDTYIDYMLSLKIKPRKSKTHEVLDENFFKSNKIKDLSTHSAFGVHVYNRKKKHLLSNVYQKKDKILVKIQHFTQKKS